MTKHYSGTHSKTFWARVNLLPEPERSSLYSSGVLLQNMEEDVLALLINAEISATIDKRQRKRNLASRGLMEPL